MASPTVTGTSMMRSLPSRCDARVRPDVDDEVEVARPCRRRCPAPPFPRYAHARAVGDAGGNLDVQALARLDRRRVPPQAVQARLPHPTGALARGTRRRATDGHRGAWCRAARRAGRPRWDTRCPGRRGAAAAPPRRRTSRSGCRRSRGRRRVRRAAGRPAASRSRSRRTRPPRRRGRTRSPGRCSPSAGTRGPAPGSNPACRPWHPELVVERALLLVRQDVVREREVLEAVLRLLVARIMIGVILAGELAVRLAYLVGRGALREPEDGV